MVGWCFPVPLVRILYWRPDGRVTTAAFLEFVASHSVDSGLEAEVVVVSSAEQRRARRRKRSAGWWWKIMLFGLVLCIV